MFGFFTKNIKPQNDKLAEMLHVTHVPVKHEPTTHLVPVYTRVGSKRMKISEKQFYRALGLMV